MVKNGRSLWRSPCLTHLLYMVLNQAHVQPSGYSQEWRLHNIFGQPMPVFVHPVRKKSFLMFKWNLLIFSLFPLPLQYFVIRERVNTGADLCLCKMNSSETTLEDFMILKSILMIVKVILLLLPSTGNLARCHLTHYQNVTINL